MTPTKAKKIIKSYVGHTSAYVPLIDDQKIERWLATKQAAALLSGEDWKEDGGNGEKVTKSYKIEWVEYPDGKTSIRRTAVEFNALEILGLMEETQFDIWSQLRGQSNLPDVVEKKRIVPEPPKPL